MRIPLYQIDAFTPRAFGGNPAAVCPLTSWLAEDLMQSIAAENNLAETAFIVPEGDEFAIRWFTPESEVDLCGHATLASAYVVFEHLDRKRTTVTFGSKSGPLHVRRKDERLELDFPALRARPSAPLPGLVEALGMAPKQLLLATSYLAVYDSERDVRSIVPDLTALSKLDAHGVIITAPGENVDFVSRFFAPKLGVPEDPVTGSAHCTLTPYWSERLGKTEMRARQVSKRGGDLWCSIAGDRVKIAGHAAPYLVGAIEI
jgi:PhzF family phenazine biosynthesis protein